ncbi:Cna B-type domain-containing protein [Bifidobacterium amazonense]|uniref:Cna B-type domain-containing protein n=1 Tax=Bifidobacterium amazonense TaxID=2809027 RepID=A0ABS9VW54_9BIFI|nr:Cna B-type domain-containing protein [Bifidobacterium amazonense]MCH9276156.1 Cna B-type domain-containing protein [Bifidobacterium amazonense]
MNANHGRVSGVSVRALWVRWLAFALASVCSITLAVSMLIVAPVFSSTAYAAEEQGSITVTYKDGDIAIAGATTHLYHVADWNSSNDGFTPTSQFKDYAVDWDVYNMDSETYRQLAETLAGYISRDGLKSQADQTTDSTGAAVFKNLPRGLYLVVIDPYEGDSLSCKSSAVLVAVPSGTSADVSLDVTLTPKTECSPKKTPPPDTPPETVKRKVVKKWANDSDSTRPSKVVVQLLQDGKVYAEAELNASNGWSYEWKDLPSGHEYRVVEKTVADNYTVLIDRESDETIVTNTYNPPNPPDDHNPPDDRTPPHEDEKTPPNTPGKKTPPAETGSNVSTAAACAVGLSGAGLAVLRIRRRRMTDNSKA